MSAVALINSAIHESNGGAPPPGANSAPVGTQFANLLDSHADQSTKQEKTRSHRVYSFAELGMFGLHRFLLAPNRPDEVKESAPAAAIASLAKISQESAPSAAITASSSSGTAVLVYVPAIEVADRPVLPSTPGAGSSGVKASASVALSSQTGEARSIESSEPEHPVSPKFAEPAQHAAPTPAKTPDDLAVVVSGPDKALAVAIRAAVDGSQEVTRLKQLIESTVAHFEMDIAQLRVNGATVGPAFSLGGGSNGGSAR